MIALVHGRYITAALAAITLLIVPASASAQAPLPACTEHVIHIDDLPSDLTESVKYDFTVSSDDLEDVNVTMAVQGQAPYWSGAVNWLDFDEPNLWIEADPGDPPLVVTATTTGEGCVDTVTRVLTPHAPQVSVLCSDYDGYGNYPSAKQSPRACTLGQQNWSYHAQGFMRLNKINHWRGWGTNNAIARATWQENMGGKAKVQVRLYRLRQIGDDLIYTRAKVTHIRWNQKIHTRSSITVKLPTHEA